VMVNLIDNALQYTPAGTPIEIAARVGAGRGVTVCVSDRGPGLPAGAENRVFEEFFRSHGSRGGPRGRGIGLGLAICRAIVKAHGGTISGANRFERDGEAPTGAVFRFTLPQQQDPPLVDATG
jgi:two-component system, OmpR family, sensor histidine kinase KdpD